MDVDIERYTGPAELPKTRDNHSVITTNSQYCFRVTVGHPVNWDFTK
jgi:hypothetical protein